ncbi:hypothetical protein [Arsukibacterium sp.]|uniref:HzsA-related protein n=1 Tax=Arsukibacterium sp. TaxID=1977258 RepID=UPI002FD94935
MYRLKLLAITLLSIALLACKADISVQSEVPDPVAQEYPLFFVARPLLNADETPFQQDWFEPAAFQPGARLILKQNAFADSPERDLLSSLFSAEQAYDVKDLALSPDGLTLLFALRPQADPALSELEQPSWSLWRYQLDTAELSPLIADPQLAEQGQDIAPAFLADGRIVFSSTRQQQSRQILLDEFKPQYTALDEDLSGPTFNLHLMNADGTDIEQLTFNLSHDLYPVVLPDGHILYSRWDNQSDRSMLNWYQLRPDGSEHQLVYGWHSHLTGTNNSRVEFAKAVVLEDGGLSIALAQNNARYYQSWPQRIELALASDNNQPLFEEVLNVPAQQSLFSRDYNNSDELNRAGYLHQYQPLQDNSGRFLISWSPCRVQSAQGPISCAQLTDLTEAEAAPPLYGLWLLDPVADTQVPVRLAEEGWLLTEPRVAQPFPRPAFLAVSDQLDLELAEAQQAVLHIRSVYDISGTDPLGIARLADPTQSQRADRPVHYLRLLRGVPIPPEEVLDVPNFAFGINRRQLMREVVGYTAVQPDGSVMVRVPANVPLALSLLNAQGVAVSPQHQQWITLRPGETVTCHGCHTAANTRPHGRLAGEWPSINPGPAQDATSYPNANPALPPLAGETMAQTLARLVGMPALSEALEIVDWWTNPAQAEPEAPLTLSYQQLETALPAGAECYNEWQASCRLRIDYPTHIQPLWELARVVIDEVTNEVLADRTCIACHSRTDAASNAQVPAGQLELTSQPSDLQAQQITSFRELLSNDNEQELIGGVLVDRLVQALDANGQPVFLRDSNGDLIVDEDGQPIPVMVTVTVPASMRVGSANNSQRFFRQFSATGSHQGYLSAAELRVIAAWLDLGAQYYNSPFAVPMP